MPRRSATAASSSPACSQGKYRLAFSIISVFGTRFFDRVISFPRRLDENGDLATKLGGACVEIGGERSPIFAIFPTQANIQTSRRLPTLGPVDVVMIRNCDTPEEIRGAVAMVTVEEATPAFFLFPPYAEDGLIAARFNAIPPSCRRFPCTGRIVPQRSFRPFATCRTRRHRSCCTARVGEHDDGGTGGRPVGDWLCATPARSQPAGDVRRCADGPRRRALRGLHSGLARSIPVSYSGSRGRSSRQ